MSIKSIKEKQLLVNLAKSFGQDVDPNLVAEVNEHKALENNIRESIRNNVLADLNKALLELKNEADRISVENNFPLPPSLDDLEKLLEDENEIELVEEKNNEIDIESEPINIEPTLAELTMSAISASAKKDSFQQPDPLLVAPDIGAIQKKIKFLEQWLGKISSHGPGGGASDTSNFTSFTKLVTTATYVIARKDFYVGVNVQAPVTITLPTTAEAGRNLIIKDESGNCKHFPITVLGTVDNDTSGFILKINNGAIQLIYRDGWRII